MSDLRFCGWFCSFRFNAARYNVSYRLSSLEYVTSTDFRTITFWLSSLDTLRRRDGSFWLTTIDWNCTWSGRICSRKGVIVSQRQFPDTFDLSYTYPTPALRVLQRLHREAIAAAAEGGFLVCGLLDEVVARESSEPGVQFHQEGHEGGDHGCGETVDHFALRPGCEGGAGEEWVGRRAEGVQGEQAVDGDWNYAERECVS